MKRFFLALLILGLTFGGSHYFGKNHSFQERGTVSFNPTPYPAVNRPFVIVVVGFNNGAYLEKTLNSIYSQNYSNYRLVYIDDGSTDGSFDLAKELIYDTDKRVTFVRNDEQIGLLANLTRVVNDSLDDEIIAVVGGVDWLAHEWVLARLNQYYANPDLWVTYGKSCEYPSYTPGSFSTPARDKSFGSVRLNTFYAGLFKEIGSSDLFDGDSSIADMAYLIPMLEMAEGHSSFIPEIFYVSNTTVSVKENPELIVRCEKLIREMASYEPISRWGSVE